MTQIAPEDEQNRTPGISISATEQKIDEQEIEIVLTPTEETEAVKKTNWLSGKRGLFLGMFMGILLALVGSRFLGASQEETPNQEEAPPASTSSQSATVMEVELGTVSSSIEATGTIAPFKDIEVYSPASNLRVERVSVQEGDYVREGAEMAVLDNSQLQAQLTQAKGSVLQAEARLAEVRNGSRSEELARAKQGVISAQARVNTADSDKSLAQKRVDRNRYLTKEGAISKDALDESINEYNSKVSNLEEAKASLAQAKEQLKELEAGERPEVITQAQGQLEQAQGQVAAIEAQLQDTRVLAPVSGKVTEVPVNVGKVASGVLFKMTANGNLELQLKVPETQLSQIEVGQRVEVTSDRDSRVDMAARVREIDPVVNEESRQAIVKVPLPDTGTLRPGMFLRGNIITSSAMGVKVPSEAVLPQADGSGKVFVLNEKNIAQAKEVVLGDPLPNNQIHIKSGLNKGDSIAVKGVSYLKDGDKVDVVEGFLDD
ncbi:MAG: efflux RND transporter periplasmic adaptor subunit [Spirulinaceae cyanobacterium]